MTKVKTTFLDELLEDPMVQMVMARDSVRPEEFRRSLERQRTKATAIGLAPAAHFTCNAASCCF